MCVFGLFFFMRTGEHLSRERSSFCDAPKKVFFFLGLVGVGIDSWQREVRR